MQRQQISRDAKPKATSREKHIANVIRIWNVHEPLHLLPENVRPIGSLGKSAWAFLDKIAKVMSPQQAVDVIVKECKKEGLVNYLIKKDAGSVINGERPRVDHLSHRHLAAISFALATHDIVGDKENAALVRYSRSVAKEVKQKSGNHTEAFHEATTSRNRGQEPGQSLASKSSTYGVPKHSASVSSKIVNYNEGATDGNRPFISQKGKNADKSAVGAKEHPKATPDFRNSFTSTSAQLGKRKHLPDDLTSQLLLEKRVRFAATHTASPHGKEIITISDSDEEKEIAIAKRRSQTYPQTVETSSKLAVKTEDTGDLKMVNENRPDNLTSINTVEQMQGNILQPSEAAIFRAPSNAIGEAGNACNGQKLAPSEGNDIPSAKTLTTKPNSTSDRRKSLNQQRGVTFISLENFSEEHTRVVTQLAETLAKTSSRSTVTVANTVTALDTSVGPARNY